MRVESYFNWMLLAAAEAGMGYKDGYIAYEEENGLWYPNDDSVVVEIPWNDDSLDSDEVYEYLIENLSDVEFKVNDDWRKVVTSVCFQDKDGLEVFQKKYGE